MANNVTEPRSPMLYCFRKVGLIVPVVTARAWRAYQEFQANFDCGQNDIREELGRRVIAAGVMTFVTDETYRGTDHFGPASLLNNMVRLYKFQVTMITDQTIYVPFTSGCDLRDHEEGYGFWPRKFRAIISNRLK